MTPTTSPSRESSYRCFSRLSRTASAAVSTRPAYCPGRPSRRPRRALRSRALMHLRTTRLRGFKSSPDEVEVRLERGVAVIVGPNGSGKSNVADGFLWATGSLSPSELRAEKPDDALFAGNAARQPARWGEVELRFDNEAGAGAGLPYAE